MTRYIGWLMQTGPIQKYLHKKIPAGGPTDQEQSKENHCCGIGLDSSGRTVEARLQGPEGLYTHCTHNTQVAEKVLNGEAPIGFQTPAKAFGADLILEVEGTRPGCVEERAFSFFSDSLGS